MVAGWWWWRKRDPLDPRVLAWAASEAMARGTTVERPLPSDLRQASAEGQVHIARLQDGHTCILLKKRVEYKGNFDGVLRCTRALHASELVSPPRVPRAYVSLGDHGIFEELYVRRRVDPSTFEVFFDLH